MCHGSEGGTAENLLKTSAAFDTQGSMKTPSAQSTKFLFVPDPALFRSEGGYLGRVPMGVSSKEQLMRALKEALQLPDYFGQNWDALADCLRDLSWFPPGRVSLVHDAVPDLPPKELRMYVDVLAAAVDDWKPRERYELRVVFPERERHLLAL